MAFSFMSVIGSAAKTIVKDTMTYDSIDDAAILPEQVGSFQNQVHFIFVLAY